MHDELTGPDIGIVTIDDFVAQLGRLRVQAGSPSYAEIASRIARRREVSGDPAERARVARSTVYDAFRPGRRRLDVRLLTEILAALELDRPSIEIWVAAAQRATVTPQPSAVPQRLPAPDSTPRTADEAEAVSAAEPSAATLSSDPTAAPAPAPVAAAAPAPARTCAQLPLQRAARGVVLLLMACVAANLIGRILVDALSLPLFLDMTGTAVAAIALGPWWGALVGLVTNLVGVGISGAASLPFTLVNITGALVWGYGVHHFHMSRSLPAFFRLNVLVALACSLVATPIILLYTGSLTHDSHNTIATVIEALHFVLVGTFLGNLLVSLFDKLVSGFVALVFLEARGQSPITLTLGGGQAEAPAASRTDG
ncbi:hypothetical protein [Nocardioides sp.]|uniref:hypothetical protein n=1 Tax=Nocardioides sp. TaxID=35761 RepID=UPI002B27B6C2|nr:hypothetical protein [Nocardioides sp.]